jgi:hypothetical protein
VIGRLIRGTDVQHASGGIRSGAAPVRPAELAGNGNLILREAQRREDAFIAGLPHDGEDALALLLVSTG